MFKPFLTTTDIILAIIIDTFSFIKRKKAMRVWLKQIKAREKCQLCGAPVTEFHHIKDKTMKINAMVRKACTMRQLIEELNKTVPLCHNCHVLETRRMRQ